MRRMAAPAAAKPRAVGAIVEPRGESRSSGTLANDGMRHMIRYSAFIPYDSSHSFQRARRSPARTARSRDRLLPGLSLRRFVRSRFAGFSLTRCHGVLPGGRGAVPGREPVAM